MPTMLKVAEKNLGADPDYDPEGEMTVVQAAKLRELCEKLNEPFDTSLNQKQALNRIIAMEEMLDE